MECPYCHHSLRICKKEPEWATEEMPEDSDLYYVKLKKAGDQPFIILDKYKDGSWETFPKYNEKMKDRYKVLGWMKWHPDKGIYLE
jgi:hypothetical protein